MLEKPERTTLLMVPLDDRRCWYRYHHLFSGFLRERLHRENREAVSELHRRASEWHEGNGTDNEAIGHALATRDFERAADVIERLRDAMVGRGEIFPLARLMMPLPEEVLRIAGFVATGRANIAWEGRANLPRAIALNRRALALLAHDQQGPMRGIAAGNLAECLLDIGDLGAASRAIDEAIENSHTAGHRAQIGASLCIPLPPGTAADNPRATLGGHEDVRAGTAADRRARRRRNRAGNRRSARKYRRAAIRVE
jgi:ATP/maltotriose-dependent transcriptional regulator MalT